MASANPNKKKKCLNDFILNENQNLENAFNLGKGAFGAVQLVREK